MQQSKAETGVLIMTQSINIVPFERIGRFVFGSVMLIGTLQFSFPPTLAFMGAYVILTAIIDWEPFYALCAYVQTLFTHLNLLPQTTKEIALST
jgi:Inner membrane protein YgaP-like, transmembrane domain